jgi:predicted peptidase
MQKELLSVLGNFLTSTAKGKNLQGNLESRTVQVDANEFNYQIYMPPTVKSETNLPVIVFLHGIGQRGSNGVVPITGAAGAIARHYFGQVPAIVLLPQCRQGSYWSDPVMDEMVMKALAQTVEEFSADARRVYLIGVSMGGYGVWHFAHNHPHKFAALVSICGGSSITKGDRFEPLARAVGATPTWLFHGADDKIVQVSESRQIVKALEANGGNVKYNEYENVGHNVWFNVLAEKDLLPWLFAQKLG